MWAALRKARKVKKVGQPPPVSPHRKWENQKKRGICGRDRPTESGKIRKRGASAAEVAPPKVGKSEKEGRLRPVSPHQKWENQEKWGRGRWSRPPNNEKQKKREYYHMKTLETILKNEVKQLEKIVAATKIRLKSAPEGHLRVKKKRGAAEYYLKDVNGAHVNDRTYYGRYLKKSEIKLARKIAQRDYDIHVIKNAEERIKAINTFLEKYDKTSLKILYEKTNQYRRELIEPPVRSDEEYIRRWQEVKYVGKAFSDEVPEIMTEKGERVRSKSEKIIADKLYMLGIPYRYEYPLVLDGGYKIHPDFTILRMPAREEVYLEHFGMMDEENYVENVMRKLDMYERNGIFLGDSLFITYETGKKPLNTRMLDGMIRNLFVGECVS